MPGQPLSINEMVRIACRAFVRPSLRPTCLHLLSGDAGGHQIRRTIRTLRGVCFICECMLLSPQVLEAL